MNSHANSEYIGPQFLVLDNSLFYGMNNINFMLLLLSRLYFAFLVHSCVMKKRQNQLKKNPLRQHSNRHQTTPTVTETVTKKAKTSVIKTKPVTKKPEKVIHEPTKASEQVANVMGNSKTTETNNKNVSMGTVKLTPKPPSPKATDEKSPRDKIGEFNKVFPKSRRAFEAKYLKTGLLPAPEAEVWDEGLARFQKETSQRTRTNRHTGPGGTGTFGQPETQHRYVITTTNSVCTEISTRNEATTTSTTATIINTTPAPTSYQPTKDSRSQFQDDPEQTCPGVIQKSTESRHHNPPKTSGLGPYHKLTRGPPKTQSASILYKHNFSIGRGSQ